MGKQPLRRIEHSNVHRLYDNEEGLSAGLYNHPYPLPDRPEGCPLQAGDVAYGSLLVYRVRYFRPWQLSIKAIGGMLCEACEHRQGCTPNRIYIEIGNQGALPFLVDYVDPINEVYVLGSTQSEP